MNPPLQKKGGNLFKKAPMIRGYIIQSSQKRANTFMNSHLVFHSSTNSQFFFKYRFDSYDMKGL